MEWNTITVPGESPGITTTLVQFGNSRDRFVRRRLDLSMTWPWSRQWLEGELEAIRRARLPHVVAPQVSHNGPDYIDVVRPYIVGLDVRKWSAVQARHSRDVYLKLMCDSFYALARLHRMGIAHGEVKKLDELSRITTPTLILHGREDRVIPVELGIDMLNVLPNADLHVFSGCGHWTQIERADDFVAVVDQFLSSETPRKT